MYIYFAITVQTQGRDAWGLKAPPPKFYMYKLEAVVQVHYAWMSSERIEKNQGNLPTGAQNYTLRIRLKIIIEIL